MLYVQLRVCSNRSVDSLTARFIVSGVCESKKSVNFSLIVSIQQLGFGLTRSVLGPFIKATILHSSINWFYRW